MYAGLNEKDNVYTGNLESVYVFDDSLLKWLWNPGSLLLDVQFLVSKWSIQLA